MIQDSRLWVTPDGKVRESVRSSLKTQRFLPQRVISEKKHSKGSGLVSMPAEKNVDTAKDTTEQNYHPLKGMLGKAVPASSHQLCGPPPQTCRLY